MSYGQQETDYLEEELTLYKKYLPSHLLLQLKDYREKDGVFHYAWPKEIVPDVIEALISSDYVLTIIAAYLQYLNDGHFGVIAEEDTFKQIKKTNNFEEKKIIARNKALKILKEWEAEIPEIIGNGHQKYEIVVLMFCHRDDELLKETEEPEKTSLKDKVINFFISLK